MEQERNVVLFETSNIGMSHFVIPDDPCYTDECLNNGTSSNDRNGAVRCSCHGDWNCLVYMFCMISLQYIMYNI